MDKILIEKLRPVKKPQRGTQLSAGIDFFVPDDWNGHKPMVIGPHESVLIPSGIRVKLPEGHALIAFNKSGVATRRRLAVGACVVDEDYQGEVHIHLYNTSKEGVTIGPGDKLVQFLLLKVNYASVEECEGPLYEHTSERGEGGFGSTGTK